MGCTQRQLPRKKDKKQHGIAELSKLKARLISIDAKITKIKIGLKYGKSLKRVERKLWELYERRAKIAKAIEAKEAKEA